MYLLHIETATKICSVALSKNGQLCQYIDEGNDAFSHGERLTLLIEEVLRLEKISMNELIALSVSAGPGSYTGLRIGVSTAKGICFGLSIPLISVNTLDAMIALAKEKYQNQTICAMIDARRMEVFSKISNENNSLKETSADVLDENSYKQFEPFICLGDGAVKMQELWTNRSIFFDTNFRPSARGQVAIAFQKFQENQWEDLAYFEPNYVKAFYSGK